MSTSDTHEGTHTHSWSIHPAPSHTHPHHVTRTPPHRSTEARSTSARGGSDTFSSPRGWGVGDPAVSAHPQGRLSPAPAQRSCSSVPGSVLRPLPGTALRPSSPSQPSQVGGHPARTPAGSWGGDWCWDLPSEAQLPAGDLSCLTELGSPEPAKEVLLVVALAWVGWG